MSRFNVCTRYRTGLTHTATSRLNLWHWWLLAIATYALARAAQLWLDANYAASGFPVPFYIGQTTFDAAELKDYYQVLLDKGTLGQFVKTQIIDYGFMAATFTSFFCLCAALLRSLTALAAPAFSQTIARFFVWFAPLAAVFDAIENGISFITLMNPQNFADWLVYPYSSFAVMKFAVFSLTYLWVLIAVVIILGVVLWNVLKANRLTSDA